MSLSKAGSLDLAAVAGGTRVRLRVHPKAKRAAVTGVHGGALKVSVTAPPERGKANRAVIELLADALAIPPSGVTIVAGQAAQDKTAVVALDPAELVRRLG